MSIRNKLILYTFASILLTLVIVGFSIDRIITSLYKSNTQTELSSTYTHFQNVLISIENDILNQTLQIATDNSVIAIINLVNRYQNKKNYQPLIFDNEKKEVATFLHKQISLTGSDRAMIYSRNGDLIAYSIKNGNGNESGIVSYKDGLPVYIKKSIHSNKWSTGQLPKSITLTQPALSNQISFLSYPGKINFISTENNFSVENNRVITHEFPNGSVKLLGIIKINKSLEDNFFKAASQSANTKISLLLHSGYMLNNLEQLLPVAGIDTKSQLYGSTSLAPEELLKNNKYYIQSYVWPTKTGKNYVLISSEKSALISALNKTRMVLFYTFIATAILIILIGIYWLERLISSPLNILAEQARGSELNQYPDFPISKGNDEISLLGNVLNNMVALTKKREEQLQITQKLSKIGGWNIDYADHSMSLSDEAYDIFELEKSLRNLTPDKIAHLFHPYDIEKIEKAHKKSMQFQTPYDITHRLQMANGKIKTVHVYSETLFDSEGKPISTEGTIQDITEQASKDEQLRRTQKMDALGKLTGGVSHDINNILGIILGYSELLQRNPTIDDKNKKYISEIIQASKRASKLTSKLLSFSRKEIKIANSVNINELLIDELHMLEKTLTVRIKLKLELDDNLWSVWLDKDELEDAILNISINAMHAMPNGGKLILSTKNLTLDDFDIRTMEIPAGDYVLFTIADTGIGMGQDTVHQIFEPFFTTKGDKGTGLGMSQVYGFVKRSNGAIHIYSDLGHGTRISLYFPRYLKNHASAKAEPESEELVLAATGSTTVLVVDDETSLRALMQEILSSKGYKTLLAEDANEALEILKNESVDLVLSDVIMPEMGGYELASIIQEKYPEIKIQMISGYADDSVGDSETNNLHINRIQKPFTANTLLQRVHKILTEQ